VSIVARILTEPSQRNTQFGNFDRAVALKEVTGNGKGFTDTIQFAEVLAKEQQRPRSQSPSKWALLAEQLGRRDAVSAEDPK
jgi:hypothetical protein